MAKKGNINELFDPKLDAEFKKFQKNVDDSAKAVLKLLEESEKFIKVTDNVARSIGSNEEKRKQLTEAEKKAAKAAKEAEALNKKILATRTALNTQRKKEIDAENKKTDAYKKQQIETARLTKEQKQNIIVTTAQKGSVEQIRAQLNKNIAVWERMSQEQRENSAEGQKLTKTIQKQDAAIKNLNAQVGRHQANVGNYSSALKGVATNLIGAFGVVGGVQLFAKVMKDAFAQMVQFQKSNAELAGVLGVTRSEVLLLTDDAIRLGKSTAFTALQVSALQIEYAKLGKTQQEIKQLTAATINLSIATKQSAAESASFVGKTLNQFNLSTTETVRVVDVLAKSFSTSALDAESLKESLKEGATAANQFGFSIEETVANLAALADAGIENTKAGTAFRNILANLNKEGLTLNEGLELITNSADQFGKAEELVGIKAATSAVILANNKAKVVELTEAYNNAGGSAEKLANEQLDTLDGKLKLLSSAWSGYTMKIADGEGAVGKLTSGIISLTTSLINASSATSSFIATWVTEGGIQAIKDVINGGEKLDITLEDIARNAEAVQKQANRMTDALYSTADAIDDLDEDGSKLEIIDEDLSYIKLNEQKAAADKKRLAEKQKHYKESTKLTEDFIGDEEELFFNADLKMKSVEKKAFEDQIALNNREIEANKKKTDAIFKQEADSNAQIKDAKKQLFDGLTEIAAGALIDQFNAIQAENLANTQAATDAQIQIQKDKLDKGLISEAEYTKEVAKITKQQRIADAKAERKNAIFKILVNTAVAVAQALPNVVLAAVVGALGLASAVAVAAKPIPAFKDGGEMPFTGQARTGEVGYEIFKTPNGQIGLTKDYSNVANWEKGTSFIPHDESKKIIESAGMSNSDVMMTSALEGIRNDVRNIKSETNMWDHSGVNRETRRGHNRTTHRAKYYR